MEYPSPVALSDPQSHLILYFSRGKTRGTLDFASTTEPPIRSDWLTNAERVPIREGEDPFSDFAFTTYSADIYRERYIIVDLCTIYTIPRLENVRLVRGGACSYIVRATVVPVKAHKACLGPELRRQKEILRGYCVKVLGPLWRRLTRQHLEGSHWPAPVSWR